MVDVIHHRVPLYGLNFDIILRLKITCQSMHGYWIAVAHGYNAAHLRDVVLYTYLLSILCVHLST